MWTKPQVAAHQRAIAAVDKHQPALDKLAEIAKHSPAFKDRIDQLQQLADYTRTLATVALTGDPHGRLDQS